MRRPTHRRRVPEEKGLMARSMAKSSTIFSTESRAGRRGSHRRGAGRQEREEATTAGRIWGRAVVTTVVVGIANSPLIRVSVLFSRSPWGLVGHL
ncbi:hypothetical protein PR202_gb17786 [Eleusine coracana subsp. coracana]|uniref:Uncharacterized protein n=1 Tax=Eleusine coracana subsp. coracana TaxID=191504 RepID=A0AAV5F3Y0_ELECO|nr:hypothetical protein PR202_gb17786 [Eleusine coracana subsp. coracana]